MDVRLTPSRPDNLVGLKVAAGVELTRGYLVAIDEDGYANHVMETQPTSIIAGRCEETVDNGAGIAGAVSVVVRPGVYRWNNSATAPVGQGHVGHLCYAEDDETVANTPGDPAMLAAAGTVLAVDVQGVWVKTGL